jgi:hypothetical protein
MINSGPLRGVAPRRGLIALRSAVAGLLAAVFLTLLALPATAAQAAGSTHAEGSGSVAKGAGAGESFDLVVGGFAVVVMVGFAGAVLWYVARNRRTITD